MRVDLLTKEYPPEIYGGAGVHVAELVSALRTDIDVVVRCFGARARRPGHRRLRRARRTGRRESRLSARSASTSRWPRMSQGADLVHSHTWYANGAGHIAKLLHGVPHVVTAHSLEPLRPWKAEQLGGGYRVSSWIEKTAFEAADAVIAVSDGMRARHPAQLPGARRVSGCTSSTTASTSTAGSRCTTATPCAPSASTPTGRRSCSSGASPGRRACRTCCVPRRCCRPDVQLVLCAGAPDTAGIMAEVTRRRRAAAAERDGVVWIDRLLPQHELSAVLTAGTAFVCPSVYEPLGIVNLEAMACGLPVVGTATGGIPEVVVDGVTGRLVPIEQVDDGTGTPIDPDRFVADLARSLTEVVSDPERAAEMGAAGTRARRAGVQLGRRSRRAPARSTPLPALSVSRGPRRRDNMEHGQRSSAHRRLRRSRWQHHPRLSELDGRMPTSAGSSSVRTARARPRCCSIAAALHCTRRSGTAEVLEEQLGGTDLFELRPRIGFASTAMARGSRRTKRFSTSC